MNIKKTCAETIVDDNYSNEMCSKCDNSVCKYYGGRCQKYIRNRRLKTLLKILIPWRK